MRIAIFDSGIGGVTVLKNALEHLPEAEYLYYADTGNAPYGVKQKHEVMDCVLRAFEFLSKMDIHAAVVACNTATSAAIAELRRRFKFPIIGMEPAVKPALAGNAGKKILLLATSLTLRESKLEELITALDGRQKIHKHALDKLVLYAEKFDFNSDDVAQYIKRELSGVDFEKFETIVLGCTHFIYYADIIRKMAGKHVAVIDGNEGTVRNLVSTIKTNFPGAVSGVRKGKITFYSSGREEPAGRASRLLALACPAGR
ncbi:MAG: glutamate racemase [Kiritimatiellia bacterium]